ncbi:hypothetical protein ACOYW6_12860 [Parablastomonas sp. CN1-191]|uniref:hypothetical protein n=1 Tax=Parablastomonas sp. CN1-191 TaxID=3400908 RepID=UPI003BF7CFC0
MAHETGPERYSICIDSSVTSREALFCRVTDTAYLGYSSFSGWDAFEEMFHDRLECSKIEIEIDNRDLLGLPERDRDIWLEVLDTLEKEFPEKLRVARSIR